MLKDDGIIGKVKIAILIGVVIAAVMGCGCTKYIVLLPSSDASPSEVVETFASQYGDACYPLMSTEYKITTDYQTFKKQMEQCTHGKWHYYEFVGIVKDSEKIDGKNATVKISYLEKVDSIFDKAENKTKTVNLVKEDGGWRLTALA